MYIVQEKESFKEKDWGLSQKQKQRIVSKAVISSSESDSDDNKLRIASG